MEIKFNDSMFKEVTKDELLAIDGGFLGIVLFTIWTIDVTVGMCLGAGAAAGIVVGTGIIVGGTVVVVGKVVQAFSDWIG